MLYIRWGFYYQQSGYDDRHTVDLLSDIIGVRWDIIALMSWVECCDVINRGWGVVYSAYYAIYTVDMMP